MNNWKTVRLGDVCEIFDSKRVPITAHERIKGDYPYYGANGIQDYVADYIFDDELVLLAEDGGNFGSKEKPIAYRVSGKCWVNNHAHVLKPKKCLDVDYLCDSIKFYDVSALVNGATRQKLTQSAMVEMQIPLPPLETQKPLPSCWTNALHSSPSISRCLKNTTRSSNPDLSRCLGIILLKTVNGILKNWKMFAQ